MIDFVILFFGIIPYFSNTCIVLPLELLYTSVNIKCRQVNKINHVINWQPVKFDNLLNWIWKKNTITCSIPFYSFTVSSRIYQATFYQATSSFKQYICQLHCMTRKIPTFRTKNCHLNYGDRFICSGIDGLFLLCNVNSMPCQLCKQQFIYINIVHYFIYITNKPSK